MSEETKKQLNQEPHFHLGQLGIIAFVAIALVGVTFMKGGLSLFAPTAALSDKNVLTYDQVKKEVSAQVETQYATGEEKTTEQIAALDPTTGGQVLGATTDMQNLFPPADQSITPEMLAQIKIKTTSSVSADTLHKYSEELLYVESKYNVVNLIGQLNNEDPATLQGTSKAAKTVVGELARITVPTPLVEYHKYYMMYYTALGQLADMFSKKSDDSNIEDLSGAFFSLTEKVDTLRAEALQKYNIQL